MKWGAGSETTGVIVTGDAQLLLTLGFHAMDVAPYIVNEGIIAELIATIDGKVLADIESDPEITPGASACLAEAKAILDEAKAEFDTARWALRCIEGKGSQ